MNTRKIPSTQNDWTQFMQLLARVRAGFADLDPVELDALIDEAVTAVRAEKRAASNISRDAT